MGEINSYKILVGKTERQEPLRRRDNNTEMDLTETGFVA
jgi:hypothetical protein